MELFESEVNLFVEYMIKYDRLFIGDRVRDATYLASAKQKASLFDFWFLYNGTFYALECKRTRATSYPLSEIKSHQQDNLARVYKQGHVAEVLLNFRAPRKWNRVFRAPIEYILRVPESLKKKSINIKDCERDLVEVARVPIGYTPKGKILYDKGQNVPREYMKFSWNILNLSEKEFQL